MILRKLNLAPRSALCFGLFCLMIITLGIIALKQASSLKDSESFVEINVVPSISILGVIDREFVSIRGSNARLRNPVEPASRKAQALEELNKARVNIQNSLSNLQPLIVTPIGKQKIDELSKSLASYQLVQDQYLSLISSGSLDEAVKLSSESMKQSADVVENYIKEIIEVNNNKAKRAGEEASRTYEQAKLAVGAFILISILAAIALALMYTRSITSPISQSLAIAERIAKNDLTGVIEAQGHDEVARLMRALNVMQQGLRNTLSLISDSSNQLASTSEEMHAVTEDANKGMLRQNNEVEMAATAVTEMSAAVEEVARNASQASEAANRSNSAALAGRARVDETVQAISLMVANVEDASQEVQGLAVMATDISKVLDVIRAIAEQTNLLALNAAIEAARAGEAGRGFAVVADEVRALAHRTQQSTSEIEQMISSIQKGTGSAVSAMTHTNTQAQKTLDTAQGAGSALVEITESIDNITERNVLIATASEEQAQVAREVDRSLVSIRDLSYQAAEGSSQTAIATSELTKLAVELNRLVKQFQM
ncbi:methyl-accepting chemotaxis protein [Pseudomonas trivialis]|jgi:methyl-accepting chemotaxis protein|uniref:HAMP domain-containing protein n=1 Tax=Pseudomonas salomonii TaxID=191391 RepID=A0ABS9GF41_9PSED|nr:MULTISPECIES: methyl-accepting chemotaxis protein [Pseudomonas]AVJ38234.1 methyl-accepting chemotaxis protein [Pseudomonas lurida]MCF5544280.1 HAMP domain-containing protein [Pseudomonas salomonii]PRA17864.1 methyl-accepting chemotaxis protein [Pseudomonas sp. MYb13]PRA20998.1 methyl-accepting chemotaxis protein [Pseudomonas lurida]PRA37729.1 methyl-accepting chemotaxis protein [Pseudomonas lurida]